MNEVSVIIVNYNTKELTKNTIQSIIKKTKGVDYEIIVADNNSQDGSVEELKNTFQNKITIIETKQNFGFGKANNLAIKQSKGKYVFLLNSDTELINNSIKIFYDYMEQNEQVGLCCGNLYNEKNIPQESCDMHLYRNTTLSYFLWRLFGICKHVFYMKNVMSFNYSNKVKTVAWCLGADMFIRKNILEKTGLFDENIFMYYEDMDLCFRIRKNGCLIKSLPEAKIIHFGSKSSNGIKNIEEEAMSYWYVMLKYFGKKTYFIYLDRQLRLLIKTIVSLLLFNKQKAKICFNMYRLNKEKYFGQNNKSWNK